MNNVIEATIMSVYRDIIQLKHDYNENPREVKKNIIILNAASKELAELSNHIIKRAP